jgi:hypothetical protein
MRKRIIQPASPAATPEDANWLPIDQLAEVEVSSESESAPIEAALLPGGTGWRAAAPGEQTIRLQFDSPQRVRRIRLRIQEETTPRLQEYVLSWSAEGGQPREIVRQQYNFSPGTNQQIEDYRVELEAVKTLELKIIPDLNRGSSAMASVAELRVAA